MAHEINFNEQTGQFSFYSVKKKAWHELGHVSDTYENSDEVIKKSQLDYTVGKQPMQFKFPSGKVLVSENDFFTFRTDNEEILGTGLPADYTVVQNTEAFAFFDAIAKDEKLLYETAGALGKGERIFITAQLPNKIKVGRDDEIELYLLLTLFHNGKPGLAALTPTRVVCNNTLNAAIANCNNSVKIIHTPDVQHQLQEAQKVMKMVNTATPVLGQAFNNWAKVKITDKQVYRLIQMAMAPDSQTLANIKEGKEELNSGKYKRMVLGAVGYAQVADSQQLDTTKGTLFGAYNAVTGYFQNVRDYNSAEAKIDSLFYGGTAQKKAQTAFNICTDFAKIGDSALFMN